MEIRGEHCKQRVRFDSLKEGEAFYYIGELYMKTSEITNRKGVLMDNELYCPMKMTSNPLGRCVCEKEKCAWWRQLDNCCSIWWIATELDKIETKMKR